MRPFARLIQLLTAILLVLALGFIAACLALIYDAREDRRALAENAGFLRDLTGFESSVASIGVLFSTSDEETDLRSEWALRRDATTAACERLLSGPVSDR